MTPQRELSSTGAHYILRDLPRGRGRYIPTPTYRTWIGMKGRCENPCSSDFEKYGGSGITVCDRWSSSFTAFLADMGPRPSLQYSIDRIDNALGYSLDNCRWATSKEQILNRSFTRWLTICGQALCISDWARRIGIDESTLRKWIDHKNLSPSQIESKVAAEHSLSWPGPVS
jgi:hypothetical protein